MWDVEIEDTDRWFVLRSLRQPLCCFSLTFVPHRRCEYIAFRNLWRVGYARVSHGDITDTELQVRHASDPGVDTTI
jgi:hypothetical protein